MSLEKARALLALATNPSAAVEEARTAAILCCKMIVAEDIDLVRGERYEEPEPRWKCARCGHVYEGAQASVAARVGCPCARVVPGSGGRQTSATGRTAADQPFFKSQDLQSILDVIGSMSICSRCGHMSFTGNEGHVCSGTVDPHAARKIRIPCIDCAEMVDPLAGHTCNGTLRSKRAKP